MINHGTGEHPQRAEGRARHIKRIPTDKAESDKKKNGLCQRDLIKPIPKTLPVCPNHRKR